MSETNRNESLPDEDSSDDGFWNEFETCATSVTHLYRNSNWRTLQSAAASTTQLYKHGLEMKKRSFDRGFLKGRLALSREISAMCRYKNKIDVADIIALLSKYDLLPTATFGAKQQRGGEHSSNIGTITNPSIEHPTGGGQQAVFLFQEVLDPLANSNSLPSTGSSLHRNIGLGNFLQHQVHRHRKRHSSNAGGVSPCNGSFDFVSKRFKRL
ncbi:hypothetical protein Mgra_00003011 [Meloidogyne graminicola]|uniref:Uncharacterized protein n=1 Tax=Meloidogyne graminicola TaxID=189291 RepID=A0A8S9ZW28_9BILA|nr:hypothetical protein Mgra_00003011 [Meloidogyne graminicola]